MPVWAPPLIGFRSWLGYTPTIPKFYWDVYSEEERIKKICMALHKIEEYLNYQTDTINKILEHWDDYEERIAALEAWKLLVDEHLAQVDTSLDALSQEDDVLHELIDDLDAATKEALAEQREDYIARDERIAEALGRELEDFETWMRIEFERLSKEFPMVTDPTTGEKVSIEDAMNHVYDALRYYAITAGQFDELDITAGQFDAMLMTAQQFDLYGYTLLTGGEIGQPVIPVADIQIAQNTAETALTTANAAQATATAAQTTANAAQAKNTEQDTAIGNLTSAVNENSDAITDLADAISETVDAGVQFTLLASAWSSGTYPLDTAYPAADGYSVIVSKQSGMTEAQETAFDDADMIAASASTSNNLVARGTVPVVDLPVNVIAVKHVEVV